MSSKGHAALPVMANLEELEEAYQQAFKVGQAALGNDDDEALSRGVLEMLKLRQRIRAMKEQTRRERIAEVMAHAPQFSDGSPLGSLLQHAVNGMKKSLGVVGHE